MFFVGDGAALCYNKYGEVPGVLPMPAALTVPRAVGIGLVGEAMQHRGEAVPPALLLPDYHRTLLTDPTYADVLSLANERKLLVLCHTWGVSMNAEQCNSADKIMAILDKYPDLTFIMGHSIQGQTELAIQIANTYPGAYLDLCDTGRFYGMVE